MEHSAAMQGSRVPCNIIADQTESSDPSMVLHDPPQRRLRVLRHTVRLVQYDDLVRRTRVRLAVRRDGDLCAGGLARKVFDLFADDGDAAFVGGVELEDAVAEVVRAVLWVGGKVKTGV